MKVLFGMKMIFLLICLCLFILIEKKLVKKAINLSVQAISFALEKGAAQAMAEYN